MDLVNFFGAAILAILALSLLSFIIDSIKQSSPMKRVSICIVLLIILTGGALLMGYPILFS